MNVAPYDSYILLSVGHKRSCGPSPGITKRITRRAVCFEQARGALQEDTGAAVALPPAFHFYLPINTFLGLFLTFYLPHIHDI